MRSYSYRRKLTRRELIPALGAGAGVGLGIGAVVAYLTQIFLRREPLARPAVAEPSAAPTRTERSG